MQFNWQHRGVVASLLLAAVAFFVIFEMPILWSSITLLLAVVAAYEWGRLCNFSGFNTILYPLTFVAFVIATHYMNYDSAVQHALFVLVALFWVFVAPWWMLKKSSNQRLLAVSGLLVLYVVWRAAALLYEKDLSLLLAGMSLVWVFDSASFFVGRLFGRVRLAPVISPKKTVEGALGGLLAVFIGGMIYNYFFAEETVSLVIMFSVVFSLAALAALGDLFISSLKRRVGLKDTGTLLGNHGGVLDRMDSLLTVLPAVALLSAWLV